MSQRAVHPALLVAMIAMALSACATPYDVILPTAHARGVVGGIVRDFRASYDPTVSAGTALDLTTRSLSMLLSPDGAAPLSMCPFDNYDFPEGAEAWQDWRKTFEHVRRVRSEVSGDANVISVKFIVKVSLGENDYLGLDFRSDANDETGWSFKCWKAKRVLIIS
jgi:hypothetical protein